MRRATAFATAILAMTSTAALSQPAAGSNVVVIQITGVRIPVALPGTCLIRGVVSEVREGAAFAPGQPLSIKAPCSDGKPHLDDRPAQKSTVRTPTPLDPLALQGATQGVAHLDDAGQLDWTPSRRGGRITGFRILQGSATRATPALTPL